MKQHPALVMVVVMGIGLLIPTLIRWAIIFALWLGW